MNHIYHEKQEGSLCAQHCLNNLLQDQYFTAVELAEIGQQMDQEETRHMAELGTNTSEFKQFLEQPSSNMDDSGMFSVQVLSSALNVWNLSLVPYASSNPLAVTARLNPVEQKAFICNFKEHWFTVRKLGYQWFNLNSLLTFPELISDTYLSLFLTQLQHEGYSIFVLDGQLPPCKADETLKANPAVQTIKPQLLSEVNNDKQKRKENEDLKAALRASLDKANSQYGASSSASGLDNSTGLVDNEDEDLRKAMRMSLEPNNSFPKEKSVEDDLEKAIRLSLNASPSSNSPNTSKDKCESPDLERALQMSLDSSLCEARVPENLLDPDLEEVRRRRLEKLDKK